METALQLRPAPEPATPDLRVVEAPTGPTPAEAAVEAAQAAPRWPRCCSARATRRRRRRTPAGASELLADRPDFRDELGNALSCAGGRSSLSAASTRRRAPSTAPRTSSDDIESPGHAAAWIAQGDLARERGAEGDAAERYRRAALALQDLHF